ncbi:PEP-CTERM sorting domain-containing protein [Rhizobacter sp. Root1221]|uniref:PEP-CTERM sorting domain-containing protein n=1 Tax=Rhizobacter sp. Root1221 TaxID=1736433 RepID=UPI000714AABC|nr:PEP-CTERM sorting domain-containing protein [Rhizobacter sp. Root1221]KQW02884.1 hypothetical protein ASC87_00580 [Rhizobacter sp. Root1221]
MNKLTQIALASVVCCFTSLAQADTTYSASFALQGWLPALRTGSPEWDGPHSLPGEWRDGGQGYATVNARDLLSTTINQTTGELEKAWGLPNHAFMHHAGGPALTMGDNEAHIAGGTTNERSHTSANASVGQTALNAGVTLTDRYAEAEARATWSRSFSLDAHSSFTFSGLATVAINGDSNPPALATTFNSDDFSFASLTLGDLSNLFGRVSTTIAAEIWNIGGLSNIFSYSVGPGGLLALTMTNNSDSVLYGGLSASSYVAVSAPIPEPETWLLLLAGAGTIGFTARKHQRAVALPAAA